MARILSRAALLLALALFLGFGCSTGRRNGTSFEPIQPGLTLQADQAYQGLNGGHNVLGYWCVTFDAADFSLHVNPVRAAASHFNTTGWLENESICPTEDCIQFSIIE